MKFLRETLVSLFIFALIIMCALFYLNLPEIAVNPDGKCEWVRIAPDFDKRECPLELPKGIKTYVWYDDEKGSQDEYN